MEKRQFDHTANLVATKKATLLDFAPVQLPDIAEVSVLVPRKQADLIEEDMQKVIAMANESVTNQDIKSVEEPVIALVIVSDIEKEKEL